MNEKEFWGRGAEADFGAGDSLERPPMLCPESKGTTLVSGDGDTRLTGAAAAVTTGNVSQGVVGGPLPDTNPKSQYGIKKVPTHSRIPWTAIILEGIVMALGGLKYGPFNWRKNQVAASVYVDAAERHLSLWNAGENDDDESKVSHLAHVRACCGILIDAIETGNLVDDRPKNQATIDLIKRNYDVTNRTT
jgi:hypothetical protein